MLAPPGNFSTSSTVGTPEMAIQGPLKELGLHDVFQLLDLGRKTGTLRVVSELRQNEGTIWFHEAAVVAATIRSNPHPLGMTLLRNGKVRQEDLTRARALQLEGDTRRLGEILVAIGAIGARDLEQQVRAQVEEAVFTLLGWSEGFFTFEEGTADAVSREATIRISSESLLLESARRIDEWARIASKVPHLGMVPVLAEPVSEEPGSLVLIPFEWRVLAAADGRTDLRSIARVLGAPDFDVARALFGLESAGVIVLQDVAAESLAAAPRDPATMLHQGEEHLRLGDAESARLLADGAIAAFPEHPGGHLLLGRSLLLEGAFEGAARALREAVRRDPASAKARRALGLALVGTGRFEEAVDAWEQWAAMADRPQDELRHEETIARQLEAARALRASLRGRSD